MLGPSLQVRAQPSLGALLIIMPSVPASSPTLAGALWLPDSPNSLIERGRLEQGRAVLERIRGTHDVNAGGAVK